jgi:hypothetical protein
MKIELRRWRRTSPEEPRWNDASKSPDVPHASGSNTPRELDRSPNGSGASADASPYAELPPPPVSIAERQLEALRAARRAAGLPTGYRDPYEEDPEPRQGRPRFDSDGRVAGFEEVSR